MVDGELALDADQGCGGSAVTVKGRAAVLTRPDLLLDNCAEVGLSLGAAWTHLGRYESARALLEQVIGIFHQLGDVNGVAAARQNLQNCL